MIGIDDLSTISLLLVAYFNADFSLASVAGFSLKKPVTVRSSSSPLMGSTANMEASSFMLKSHRSRSMSGSMLCRDIISFSACYLAS